MPCAPGPVCGDDYRPDFARLKSVLAEPGYSVPSLYRQYSGLCEPGGVSFSDFNVDPRFADCVDGFVIVDTDTVKIARRRRYMEMAP